MQQTDLVIDMDIANNPIPHPRPNMTDNATSIKSCSRTNFIWKLYAKRYQCKSQNPITMSRILVWFLIYAVKYGMMLSIY